MMAANPITVEELNINISAYRVLYILLLLVQYRSLNTLELNRFLSENPLIQRAYNSETLTKYINTLREVGCDIPRSNGRNDYSYELRKAPFPLALAAEEWELLTRLMDILSQDSQGRSTLEGVRQEYHHLLQQLQWMLNDDLDMKDTLTAPTQTGAQDSQTCGKQSNGQLYRRFCQEAFALEIQYQDAHQPLQQLTVEPHELFEEGPQLTLLGVERETQEAITLDVSRIDSVRQLPVKNKRTSSKTTVKFALYGRLAKNYRLYPDEKVVYRRPEEIHVKTSVAHHPALLLNRLLKYGSSCQVLAPGSLREAMNGRIEAMLSILTQEATELAGLDNMPNP